jgi:hypothetical protein
MEKNEALDKLFEEWQKNHSAYTNENFVKDGIINEELWNKAKKKVLFVLKEPNKYPNKYKGDFRKFVDSGPWRVVGYWAYGLQNTDDNTIPSLLEAKVNENWKTACCSSAMMNLKKSPGGATANMEDLMQAAKKDSKLIFKEIEIIRPDIVICGSTFKVCNEIRKLIMPFKDFQPIGPDKRCFSFQNAIWIDFYHPSAPFWHEKRYNDLMRFYQNCLKELPRDLG